MWISFFARFIQLYVCIMCAAGFVVMAYDKLQAILGGWRVPERELLFIALMGGALGVLLAMIILHHKIRKTLFSTRVLLLSMTWGIVLVWTLLV